jgi:exodeoxyribonuclease-3
MVRRKRSSSSSSLLVSDALKDAAKAADIERTPRTWERPSDHTPVSLELDDA